MQRPTEKFNFDFDKVIISNTDELQKFCYKLENEDKSFVMADRIYIRLTGILLTFQRVTKNGIRIIVK